jgi:hypothetical protein
VDLNLYDLRCQEQHISLEEWICEFMTTLLDVSHLELHSFWNFLKSSGFVRLLVHGGEGNYQRDIENLGLPFLRFFCDDMTALESFTDVYFYHVAPTVFSQTHASIHFERVSGIFDEVVSKSLPEPARALTSEFLKRALAVIAMRMFRNGGAGHVRSYVIGMEEVWDDPLLSGCESLFSDAIDFFYELGLLDLIRMRQGKLFYRFRQVHWIHFGVAEYCRLQCLEGKEDQAIPFVLSCLKDEFSVPALFFSGALPEASIHALIIRLHDDTSLFSDVVFRNAWTIGQLLATFRGRYSEETLPEWVGFFDALLMRLAEDSSVPLRQFLFLDVLAKNRLGFSFLESLALEGDDATRVVAVRSLGEYPEAGPFLVKLLNDRVLSVAVEASSALKKHHSPSLSIALLESLPGMELRRQQLVLGVLADSCEGDTFSGLFPYLNRKPDYADSESITMQLLAFRAMSRTGLDSVGLAWVFRLFLHDSDVLLSEALRILSFHEGCDFLCRLFLVLFDVDESWEFRNTVVGSLLSGRGFPALAMVTRLFGNWTNRELSVILRLFASSIDDQHKVRQYYAAWKTSLCVTERVCAAYFYGLFIFLGENPVDGECDPDVLSFLSDANPRVKLAAIWTIEQRQLVAFSPMLHHLLMDELCAEPAWDVLKSLHAEPHMMDSFAEKKMSTVWPLARLLQREVSDAVGPMSASVLGDDSGVRREAIRLWLCADADGLRRVLLDALRSPQWDVAQDALEGLILVVDRVYSHEVLQGLAMKFLDLFHENPALKDRAWYGLWRVTQRLLSF